MIVKQIKLTNFRNYKKADIILNKDKNLFVGKNAQGKTNLIEAVYFCCIAKSFRTNKEKDLIKWGEKQGKIEILFSTAAGDKKISFLLSGNKNKTIRINETQLNKTGEVLGHLNCVLFSPQDLKIIKESPDQRRSFMDINISQTDKKYFYSLVRYNKILSQRNNLLKKAKGAETIKESIEIWDRQMAKYASIVIFKRLEFLKKIKKYAQTKHLEISGTDESLSIQYNTSKGFFNPDESIKVEEIEKKLIQKYKDGLDKDFNLGYTLFGPHRDDIDIKLNNKSIRDFGSQGQQRSAALSLKLSELDIIYNETGERPILLLDDVFSELDDDRERNIIKSVENNQTIIASTKMKSFMRKETKIHNVKMGEILYE